MTRPIRLPEDGSRIRLLVMENDPPPIPIGSLGTVCGIECLGNGLYNIRMRWDSGRTLSLALPRDQWEYE